MKHQIGLNDIYVNLTFKIKLSWSHIPFPLIYTGGTDKICCNFKQKKSQEKLYFYS